jgi:hypothetical protein
MLVPLFGHRHVVDLRLDQTYLRSEPVNSEEGAPMGIGIWYEMWVSDPVSYLYKNADPRGSLRANVSNATVRSLSNMKLGTMLENRHQMSQAVRNEVSPLSKEWGYMLGSVYIRKVHFRDVGMIRQIEEKVVNRLRQVTSAIRQDGANQVSIITSSADRQAAIEFAKAAAVKFANRVGSKIAAVPHHRHPLGNIQHLVEPVTNEKAGNLLAFQLMNDSQEPLNLLVAQGRGRLIHNDQPRLRRQRTADRHQLACGDGKPPDKFIQRQRHLEPVHHRLRLLAHRLRVCQTNRCFHMVPERDILSHCEVGKQREVLVNDLYPEVLRG